MQSGMTLIWFLAKISYTPPFPMSPSNFDIVWTEIVWYQVWYKPRIRGFVGFVNFHNEFKWAFSPSSSTSFSLTWKRQTRLSEVWTSDLRHAFPVAKWRSWPKYGTQVYAVLLLEALSVVTGPVPISLIAFPPRLSGDCLMLLSKYQTEQPGLFPRIQFYPVLWLLCMNQLPCSSRCQWWSEERLV